MGRVFRAEDTQLQRHIALKVIVDRAERGRRSNDHVGTLIREARSAARLDHPGVVTVHDVGSSGDIHYVAMELVEGGNLDDLVKAGGPLDVQRACQLCAEIAEALQYAHSCGIIHRDVKPANLMLTRTGRCKLGDFGLARLDDPKDSFALHGPAVGTPLYAAPEVIRHEPATPESDVYSLGATLFHLLTGQPPFMGRSASEVMEKHISEVPPDVRVFRPDVTEDQADLVARALSKRPEDRFESAGQMAAMLRMQTIPVGPVGSGSTGVLPQLWGSGAIPARVAPARRRRGPMAIAAIAGMIIVGVGGYLAYNAWQADRKAAARIDPPTPLTAAPRSASVPAPETQPAAPTQTFPVSAPVIYAVHEFGQIMSFAKAEKKTSVILEGVVSEVKLEHSVNKFSFINFAGVPREKFYCVIYPEDLGYVSRAFPDSRGLSSLESRRIRVTGEVELYPGKPQIKLLRPEQIRVLD